MCANWKRPFINGWSVLGFFVLIVVAAVVYIHLFQHPPTVDMGYSKLKTKFINHRDIVTGVRFGTTDSLIISASVDSTINVWNSRTAKVLSQIKQNSGIASIDVSGDGNFVVTGSYDGLVRLFRINDGVLMRGFKAHTKTVWAVCFSPDGQKIASGGEDAILNVWNVADGKLTGRFKGHSLTIWGVKFSPDGKTIATSSFDRSWKLWSTIDGKILIHNYHHGQAVVDLAFSRDGTMIATASDDGTVAVWKKDGSLIKLFTVPEHVQAVAFSPDNKRLVAGGRDKTMVGELVQNFLGDSYANPGVSARLWDLQSGELLQTFREHKNDVSDIAYSSNGKFIATSSADGSVLVWELIK